MIHLRTPCLLILLAAALALGADKAPPGKDPQSAYEPRSAPGAGQDCLKQFVGDWEVVKTFYPRSGEPVEDRGECRQTMIHGGRFLKSEFVFRHGGASATGLGIIGFEPASGQFTSVWTDSRSTRMSIRQSRDKFDGHEIVLYGKPLAEGGRGAPRSRTVTRLEDGGRKIVHRQYVLVPDQPDRLVMQLVMTRKEAAGPGGR